jgi:hypothetical protein
MGQRPPRRTRAPSRPGSDPSRQPHGGQGLGELTAGAQRRGRPRPLTDTWIAACCIEAGLPLLTLNRRDIADFAQHDGLVLLGT